MPSLPACPCSVCGTMLKRSKSSLPPGRIKCQACRKADPKPRHAPKPRKPQVTKPCAGCGEVMVCPPRQPYMKYCTELCKYQARLAANPRCACGNLKHSQAPYCRTCTRSTRYERTREVAIQTREQRINHKMQVLLGEVLAPKPATRIFKGGTCKVCGGGFLSLNGDVTCSSRCQARHATEVRNDSKQRRRARERQAFVSRVSRINIYKRDEWTCKLCYLPIDRDARAPEPLSASIDHIIPLSKGGTHGPSNVQASHFLCNSIKGDRDGIQPLSSHRGYAPTL